MAATTYEYGMIGLGTMGRNLLLNMSDHGYSVAGFDKNEKQVKALEEEGKEKKILATTDLEKFINALQLPRTIILLVPAGKIVDEVIRELKPFLSKADLILDCGNSHFTDTDKRIEQLKSSGIHFMGVGVSGGEAGARFGPSIMPGGPKEVYARVKNMLEDISAKVNGEPCVTWLGPGSAGHYVKMVHNGIEYGIMQLIAEVYHLLKVPGKMVNDELHTVFSQWNKGLLSSFLIEITAAIFGRKDDLTGNDLVDMILDRAKQKGTGGWASEDAMKLQVPIPVIDIAVSMRDLSAYKEEREAAHRKLQGPEILLEEDKSELLAWLEQALYFAMITTYSQGMALLKKASEEYNYELKPAEIAKIWRGGCIIRASLLDTIYTAFTGNSELVNLMMDEEISVKLIHAQESIRKVIKKAVDAGVPFPAMMAALGYYDGYRSGWLPANLVQAQRDNFGAHTYERNDRKGIFHTEWNQKQEKNEPNK
ncbi:NADP-dependent phosphogluconate dehydrogenase [soil metagenome]